MKILLTTFSVFSLLLLGACGKADGGAGSIPDIFTKQVDVFEIPVIGTAEVSDEELLHVATILAEYLDSDEDGQADDPDVVKHMAENDSYMVLAATGEDLEDLDFGSFPSSGDSVVTVAAADLVMSTDYENDGFDPAIEEVLHMVTSTGFAAVYPDIFGEKVGSAVADAMDEARGGQFASIPSSYPNDAWYTYSDESCDYKCQVTEYSYWLLTSHLGIQNFNGRDLQIQNEWLHNTPTAVQNNDSAGYDLLTEDGDYTLPSAAPDLSYEGSTLEVKSR